MSGTGSAARRVDLVRLRRELPAAMASVVEEYERHLELEANRSAHTVRAYVGDAVGLLNHVHRLGGRSVADVDLPVLRGWLAVLQRDGAARSTVARRGASLRTFTGWAHGTGRLSTDPGRRLPSPRPRRTLPPVLRTDQAAALMDAGDAPGAAGGVADPIGLRDRVAVELLYATGIRVAELAGLDIDDVDRGRRVVRVFGKGAKERSVPYGLAAERALDDWLTRGRPALAAAGSGSALLLGARGRRIDPRTVRTRCTGASPVAGAPDLARTGCGTPRPPTCSTVAPTCAPSRNSSGTRAWRPPRSTPTSRSSGCVPPSPKPTPAPDPPRAIAARAAAAPVRAGGAG